MEAPFTALTTDVVSRWLIDRAGITVQDVAERLSYIGEPEFEWSTMPPSARPWFMTMASGEGCATLTEGSHLVPGRGVWVNGAVRCGTVLMPPVVRIEDRVLPQTVLSAAVGGTLGDVIGRDPLPDLADARIVAAEVDAGAACTILTLDPEWRTHPLETR